MVEGHKQLTCVVVKIRTDRSGKLESYQRGLSQDILFTPRRLINWSSKLIPFRGRWWGTAPVNVRSISEKHNAVRQADSGLGADARADPVRLP